MSANRRGLPNFVYFVEDSETHFIKIGYSCEPKKRTRQIEASSGRRMKLLATMPGGIVEERAIHEALRETRGWNEWFHPSQLLSTYIQQALGQPIEDGVTAVYRDRVYDAYVYGCES